MQTAEVCRHNRQLTVCAECAPEAERKHFDGGPEPDTAEREAQAMSSGTLWQRFCRFMSWNWRKPEFCPHPRIDGNGITVVGATPQGTSSAPTAGARSTTARWVL